MDAKQLKEHLNKRPPGKAPDPELYKNMVEGLSGKTSKLPEYLESLTKGAMPAFQLLKKELETLQMPKRKKDFMYKGRQCVMEQLSDGRMILKFNTLEESDSYFEAPLVYTNNQAKLAHQNGYDLALSEFRNMPWYKRLFYK